MEYRYLDAILFGFALKLFAPISLLR